MTVVITLTTAATDTGPFDLYSNLDGYVTPFAIGVSKGSLLGGYTSTVCPDYTITVRCKSAGDCVNYVDIVLTNAITTTTTSTTVAFIAYQLSSPGKANPGLSCAEVVFPTTVYTNYLGIGFGSVVYTDSGLTTILVGADLWFQESVSGTAFRINNLGVIDAYTNC